MKPLNERELKVQKLMKDGVTIPNIATAIGVSKATAERIVRSVREKTGAPKGTPGGRPVDGKHKRPNKNGGTK